MVGSKPRWNGEPTVTVVEDPSSARAVPTMTDGYPPISNM